MSKKLIMAQCRKCLRSMRLSRATFPYSGELNEVCVACIGKYNLAPEDKPILNATREQALRYLLSKGM